MTIIRSNSLFIPLADESVHCVITSPPYWGLRDYGTAKWEGGDVGCDHKVDSQSAAMKQKRSTLGPKRDGLTADNAYFKAVDEVYRSICGKCGATRIDKQLGLESTPEEYVGKMVEVFREVKRVLRSDGTLWLNLGDSYASSGGCTAGASSDGFVGRAWNGRKVKTGINLKSKDLVGIPWRVAFALQADGWYLRSDIIWAKPNPMPESVTDRPTKAHEYLFLLSKSPRYYFDAEAVREKAEYGQNQGVFRGGQYVQNEKFNNSNKSTFSTSGIFRPETTTRNCRTVWEIATQPFSEAHFATFPEELVRKCLFAGTSEKGCCPKCGGPWVRILERGETHGRTVNDGKGYSKYDYPGNAGAIFPNRHHETKTIGWHPSCGCNSSYDDVPVARDDPVFIPYSSIPCTVFDPFLGSGTVGVVAQKYNRKWIGLELKSDYCRMAKKRTENTNVAMI